MTSDFFDEPLAQSLVKARIVAKYFSGWSRVMMCTRRHQTNKTIGFYDLFAGTGSYEDGSKSTPLLILENALASPELSQHLVTIFNDKEQSTCTRLRRAIETLPGVERLKHKPQISRFEVDSDIAEIFKSKSLIPSILYLDPWGYKGVSLELIGSVVKDWGCECIFFFNYRRVNAAFDNPLFDEHVDALFGTERARSIRAVLKRKSPYDREVFILDQLVEALKSWSAEYVMKFRFVSPNVERTSHYLIFVTKGFRGYEIMKDIMAGESVPKESVVPTFEFTENPDRQMQLMLADPHEDLAITLHSSLRGKTCTFSRIYEQCSPNTNFIKRNFRSALTILEQHGKLSAQNEDGSKRREGTFGDKCRITFNE